MISSQLSPAANQAVARVLVHPGGTHMVMPLAQIRYRVIAGRGARLDTQSAGARAPELLRQQLMGAVHIAFEVHRQAPIQSALAHAQRVHGAGQRYSTARAGFGPAVVHGDLGAGWIAPHLLPHQRERGFRAVEPARQVVRQAIGRILRHEIVQPRRQLDIAHARATLLSRRAYADCGTAAAAPCVAPRRWRISTLR
jgi:hypothetical protein